MKPGDRVTFTSGYHVGMMGKLVSLDYKQESARVRLEHSPNIVMTVDANTIRKI